MSKKRLVIRSQQRKHCPRMRERIVVLTSLLGIAKKAKSDLIDQYSRRAVSVLPTKGLEGVVELILLQNRFERFGLDLASLGTPA